MIGVLAHYAQDLRLIRPKPHRVTKTERERTLILNVLRRDPERLLTWRQIRGELGRLMPKSRFRVHLCRLEKLGEVTVDRAERPYLYGLSRRGT